MTTDLLDINLVGVPRQGKDTFLQTQSGILVSVLNPDPATISLKDVAHSLSLQCRYNGHCKSFYSVAEHTVRGAEIILRENLGKDLLLAWLLHDATEAYVGDVVRPVKAHLQAFKDIEQLFAESIFKAFSLNLTQDVLDGIFYVDNVMVAWEKRDLFTVEKPWTGLPDISGFNLQKLLPWAPTKAKQKLTKLFQRYFNGSI